MEVVGAQGAVAGVVDQLRSRILTGALPAGTTLPAERDLAAQLSVSRPTLRQGLSILSQMGLVTTQRGRNGGAVVTAPSPATVSSTMTLLLRTRAVTAADLTGVRRGLEIEAAQLAATRRSDGDLVELIAALDRYVAGEDDPASHNRFGREFHYAVARASGNPLLVEMMYSLNEAFAECLGFIAESPAPRGTAEAIHHPIVAAIERRDVDGARLAMVRHFDQLDRVLTELGIQERRLGAARPEAPIPGKRPTSAGVVDASTLPHPAGRR